MYFSFLNEDENENEINYSKIDDVELTEEGITVEKLAFIVPLLEKIFCTKVEKHANSEADLITKNLKFKLLAANFLKNAFSNKFISVKFFKTLILIKLNFRKKKLYQNQ